MLDGAPISDATDDPPGGFPPLLAGVNLSGGISGVPSQHPQSDNRSGRRPLYVEAHLAADRGPAGKGTVFV